MKPYSYPSFTCTKELGSSSAPGRQRSLFRRPQPVHMKWQPKSSTLITTVLCSTGSLHRMQTQYPGMASVGIAVTLSPRVTSMVRAVQALRNSVVGVALRAIATASAHEGVSA